jgi:hypothetical protein
VDFEDVTQTLNFAEGEMSKTVNVALTDDQLFEGEERATFTLSNPTNGVELGERTEFGLSIFSDDPFPRVSLSPSALYVMEPTTGTRAAVLRLRLSNPSSNTVTVTYSTQDATASAAAGDYVAVSDATATFQPGQTETVVNLTINSDGLQEPGEMFFVAIEESSGANSGPPAFVHITTPVSGGGVLISEFRLRGPDPDGDAALNGADDEFIELYNNSASPITVGEPSSSGEEQQGWALVSSDDPATPKFVVPAGTVIPARGHYLIANSNGYSLSSPATGEGVAPDGTYATGIPDNAGIALFRSADPSNFTLDNRLDAVGATSEANTLFREGAGYAALTPGVDLEYAFVRDECGKGGQIAMAGNCPSGGLPVDTDNNATDFFFVETSGATAGAGQRLGAPGPQNLFSTVNVNSSFGVLMLDPTKASTASPNRIRKQCSTPGVEECNPLRSALGTLSIRRRFINQTGAEVSRLRFRIIDITTLPQPSPNPGALADVRAIPSGQVTGVVVNDSATCAAFGTPGASCTVTVEGTALETPPAQALGGGFNSTLAVGAPSGGVIVLATPLAAGASINVQFLLGVQVSGNFRFLVNIEALP